jgi:hypothetical protein
VRNVCKVPHARQENRDPGLVVPDFARFAVGLDHQETVLGGVKVGQGRVVPAQLVAQNQYQVTCHALSFVRCIFRMGGQVLGALDLSALHRSLQYSTLSQFLAQLLRQLMARPQTAQGFCGKSCLFPLKPEGLGMCVSNEKGLA